MASMSILHWASWGGDSCNLAQTQEMAGGRDANSFDLWLRQLVWRDAIPSCLGFEKIKFRPLAEKETERERERERDCQTEALSKTMFIQGPISSF